MTPRTVTILGSTGSIGTNTLDVVRGFRRRFRVKGLAVGSNGQLLLRQIAEFSPPFVYVDDESAAMRLKPSLKKGTRLFTRREGLREFSRAAGADILIAATTGTTALLPVVDALEAGRRVGLANKEILVMAGSVVMRKLKANSRATLVPIDSEHSAIFQCLQGANSPAAVRRIILTGSGGPLREVASDRFASIPKSIVIRHPKWSMGRKISVDSATLMNKGLEIIEASWLFGVPVPRIDVLIHPEAVVHSMVEFIDGSVMAQMGPTDMRLPIQYALSYPDRLASPPARLLDWAALSRLTFLAPDRKKFPCLDIAYQAAAAAGSAPCVLSAADEVAVGAFLDDRIRFTSIPHIIEKVLSRHKVIDNPGLGQIRRAHEWASEETRKLCLAR